MGKMNRRSFLKKATVGAASLSIGGREFLAGGAREKQQMPAYLKGYEELWQRDPKEANLQWFRDARLGLFMHYGVYSLSEEHVWYMYGVHFDQAGNRVKGKPVPISEYEKLANQFTAENFDADFITDLALEAGCKYVNITTRHHDGFCLWDSDSESFNVMNTPAKRDLVGELSEACHNKGLGFLPYWSFGRDWRHPHAPPFCRPPYEKYYGEPDPHYAPQDKQDIEKYNEFARRQVTELITRYKLAGIWLDGVGVGRRWPEKLSVQQMYDHIHRLQPWALVSYKSGVTGTEDFIACEYLLYDGSMGSSPLFRLIARNAPRENCQCIGRHWGWSRRYADVTMNEAQLWRNLMFHTAQDANWLLDTGPRPDGSLNPAHVASYRKLGELIRQRGMPATSGPDYEKYQEQIMEKVGRKILRVHKYARKTSNEKELHAFARCAACHIMVLLVPPTKEERRKYWAGTGDAAYKAYNERFPHGALKDELEKLLEEVRAARGG